MSVDIGRIAVLALTVSWPHFPLVAEHGDARRWLQLTANVGRAPNIVDAYGRAVDDHLRFCRSVGADPLTSGPDVIAAWIGDLHERPNSRAATVLHVHSLVGLSNATIHQRIIAVRSFYEYLVEDGLRERNPVPRGESAGEAGRRGGALCVSSSALPGFPTS